LEAAMTGKLTPDHIKAMALAASNADAIDALALGLTEGGRTNVEEEWHATAHDMAETAVELLIESGYSVVRESDHPDCGKPCACFERGREYEADFWRE
jgi:hypothetical protein